MRRYAQTVLVLLLGAMLLKLVITGDYTRYVQSWFAVPLVLAGLALVAVAAVTLWRWIRALPLGFGRNEPVHIGVSEAEGIFGPYRLGARDRQPYGRGAFQRDPFAADPFENDSADTNPHGPDERAEAAGWAAAEHEGTGNILAQRTPSPAVPLTAHATGTSDTVVVPVLPVGETVALPALPAGTGDTVVVPLVPSGAAETMLVPVVRDGDGSDEPETLDTLTTVDPAEPGLPDPDLPDPDLDEADGASGGTSDGLRVGWLLLAAALILLVVAPPALGSFPATRADTVAVTRGVDPLPAGAGPVAMSLTAYVAAARAGGTALADREVRLVGFVVAGTRGEPYLARLVIGCCAAGARPVWVGLTGDLPELLEQGRWVEVVGGYSDRIDRDPINGQPVPYLDVVAINYIDPPADPYEN